MILSVSMKTVACRGSQYDPTVGHTVGGAKDLSRVNYDPLATEGVYLLLLLLLPTTLLSSSLLLSSLELSDTQVYEP